MDEASRLEPLEVRTTDDGSRTLFDPAAAQTYHSGRGAWTETQHVFVRGSGVAERLARGGTVRVVEIGLGTGMNLLATWDAARAAGARLAYRAVELRPPSPALVRALGLDACLEDRSLLPAWLEILDGLRSRSVGRLEAEAGAPEGVETAPSLRTFEVAPDLDLEVALGDAAAGPDGTPTGPAAEILAPGWADALFHDAFSREASPSLWSDAFLAVCARALAPGGAWVSYSVAGEVRRSLAAAGLDVAKLPGPPGGKREMLRAVRPRDD